MQLTKETRTPIPATKQHARRVDYEYERAGTACVFMFTEPKRAVQRIDTLSVIGGFLDGLQISFGVGLNTIIGARGTGKTTAVEFIGYVLDSMPSREHAADEWKRIDTLVKRNLGGGRICVGIRARDGSKYNVTRSVGDEPIILDSENQPVFVRSGSSSPATKP
ncbi:MAG: AAA family ATPase [Planctomycetaceae bacterium]|nr:AAA family ATPase [Planctomycetaceae bacterium]